MGKKEIQLCLYYANYLGDTKSYLIIKDIFINIMCFVAGRKQIVNAE